MIKIELLDYIYNNEGQNQVNFNNVTTYSSYVVTSERIDIPVGAGLRYIYPVTGELASVTEYEISITVANITGSGSGGNHIGFSSGGIDGLPNGIGSTVRRTTDGTTTHTFTTSGAGTGSNARLFASDGIGGTAYASLRFKTGINPTTSIIGILDVGNSDDFPLALNFSISEARDLQARTGTYSKTFEIPATKNNNKILKSSYYEGSIIEGNEIYTRKDCRIIIDDIYSVTGQLQITAVGKSTSPSYYSCVFYGDNVDWASALDNKLLMNLAVRDGAEGSGWDNLNYKGAGTGVGLEVNEPSITATWQIDNALTKTAPGGSPTTSTSPIVYPISGYGNYNSGAGGNNIQLYKTAYEITGGSSLKTGYYGWWNDQTEYPNEIPSCDWRPAIFIYDIVKAIFLQEGYTISSTFIETDFFKKLLMLLPNFVYNNPQERVDANSFKGVYEGSGIGDSWVQYMKFITPATDTTTDRWMHLPSPTSATNFNNPNNTRAIQFNGPLDDRNFIQSLNTSMYDNSTGEFTIPEFGFYDIEVKNFSIWITSFCEGTAAQNKTDYFAMNTYVKTVGQGSWNEIEKVYAFDEERNWNDCPEPKSGDNYNMHNIPPTLIENRYFNKGDKIIFRFICRCGLGSVYCGGVSGSCTTGWKFDFYGGSNAQGPAPNYTSTAARINITHRGDKVEYGQTYDLKNVIDNESTQLNFLKGVIHAFNLQFTTDVNSKIVYIEPFNDFFSGKNEAIDWSSKLDLLKNQEDKWVESTLKREFIFKYKTDSADKKVEYRGNLYWGGILDEHPYKEYLSDDFEVGQTVFENPFFAGTYNSGDQRTSGLNQNDGWDKTPFRALLWGNCEGGSIPYPWEVCRAPKGYGFVPRLLNYVKDDCQPWLDTPVQYWAGVVNFGFVNGSWHDEVIVGGNPNSSSISYGYEQMARACSYDNTGSSINAMQPLTYNSKNQSSWNCVYNTFSTESPYRGLYQTYYQGMIEMMKETPRIKVAYFNLKMTDINNLDLRKLIYIDGYYYRINRIIDYRPNSNEVTKVELVLWNLKKVWPVHVMSFN